MVGFLKIEVDKRWQYDGVDVGIKERFSMKENRSDNLWLYPMKARF